MKNLVTLVFTLLIGCFSLAQETFPVNGTTNPNHTVYAFTNAKIIVDADETIDNATLLIKDGIIIQVGTKVSIPKGSVIFDLKGKSIYPALIDAYTNYGMPENKTIYKGMLPQMGSNTKGAYGWNQAVKAETEAFKIFAGNNLSADEFRKLGFGAVLTFQKDGIVRGSGTIVSLADGKENLLILSDKAAALFSFDKGCSTQDYPSSLMGTIALIRQTYLDADWYKNQTPLASRR